MRERIKEHPLIFMAAYMVFYLTAFGALQSFIKPRFIIECALDQYIPFVKWAIIPYCIWYVWMPVMLLYFMWKSREDFWRLAFVLFTGMTFCLLVYLVLPKGLSLRHTVYGDDLLCQIIRLLYSIDPPANVCPSIHVFNTLAVMGAIHRSRLFEKRRTFRVLAGLLSLSICLSTVLLNQHSCVDVFCAGLLFVALEHISLTRLDGEIPFCLHKAPCRPRLRHRA